MLTTRMKYALILSACVVMTGVGYRAVGPATSAMRADEPPPVARATPVPDNESFDLDRIQGTWTLALAVHDGKILKDDLGSYRWTITENRIESSTAAGAVGSIAVQIVVTACSTGSPRSRPLQRTVPVVSMSGRQGGSR